jgi:peptide/nickel transport system ATP-binding protein
MKAEKKDLSADEVVLDISGLTVRARSGNEWHTIVSDVSLSLRRGEILGLVGESGSGKTTIGLAALGFARSGCEFAGGAVRFKGQDLLRMAPTSRRALRGDRIAYVAQSAASSFNPAQTLMDQVIEPVVDRAIKSRTEAKAEARALFRLLHLPDPDRIGERYPHELSGGQLQRVMAAMAMLPRPDLVIFDEPTTALDVTTQVEVLSAIRELVARSGTAAIYISHDLAVVAQLADRIMVLRHGKLVEEGATQKMLAEPQEAYTRSLWAIRSFGRQPLPRSDVLLEVNGVSASYGALKVLDTVSLTLEQGRTVAVVGESGSGKSTLARVVTGLLRSDQGEIRFCGETLAASARDRSKTQLQRLQIVHQSADASLNPRHRVREVIGRPLEFFFGLSGARRDRRIVEILEQVELGAKHLDRFPGELSGGQKQRVCIARALAAEPALIICDEATSALDQLVQEEILRLLSRLQREQQISYLFITHDIATVRAIADRIVVMHRGRVVQEGTKDEVLTPPHPAYTKLLLSSVPEMDPGWLDRLLASRAATALDEAVS